MTRQLIFRRVICDLLTLKARGDKNPFLTNVLQLASFVSSAPTFFNRSPTIDSADMRVDDELDEVDTLKVYLNISNLSENSNRTY